MAREQLMSRIASYGLGLILTLLGGFVLWAALGRIQQAVVMVTPLIFVAGMALLTCLMMIMRRYRRHIEQALQAGQELATIIPPAKTQLLRTLLQEKQISVVFQPIWDLSANRILAYEALSRPAPTYGFNGPQEAFDIAEHCGQTHMLDLMCLQAILARANELPPATLLFINVCPLTLDQGALAGDTLTEMVKQAGLTPDRIVIEITERAVRRVDVVVREAIQLRAQGFRLALDDTGAGNAGLEMLSKLPLDYVKVDRQVIVNAFQDQAARGVLIGIIAIAQASGSYVIAEGIEDAAMLDFVQSMHWSTEQVTGNVQGVQGYFLGRPNAQFITTVPTEDSSKAA